MNRFIRSAVVLFVVCMCLLCISCQKTELPQSPENNNSSEQVSTPDVVKPLPQNMPDEKTSDNTNTNVSPQTQEPQASSSIVTETQTVSDSQSSWDVSFDKGKECVSKGNIRLATFYFVNALGKNPGNMEIIQKYREVIQNTITKSTDEEEKYSYYAALETFLQNQIATVPADKVELISQWLDEISAQRNQMENATIADSKDSSNTLETDELSDTYKELVSALDKQEQNVKASIESGKTNPIHLDIASYQLQDCEQIMRSLIALSSQLKPEQQSEIAESYKYLKELGMSVVDAKAKVLWDEFYAGYQKFIEEYRGLYAGSATPTTYGSKEGNMEKRLKLVRKEMSTLQALLPKLSEKYVGDMSVEYDSNTVNAAALIQQMQTMLRETSENQQKLYNQWAIDKIKNALNAASSAEGTFTNGEKGRIAISDALISNLAPIDQRFITNEVNRCYQEVLNKYLASNHLNPVKNEKSWDENGNMGHTMLEMFNMTKVQMSQF